MHSVQSVPVLFNGGALEVLSWQANEKTGTRLMGVLLDFFQLS